MSFVREIATFHIVKKQHQKHNITHRNQRIRFRLLVS